MKTATIVKSYASNLQGVLSKEELHNKRVAQVIGIDDMTIPLQIREKLYDSNLVWMVGQDFVRKFKYAACIRQGVVFEPFDHKDYPLSNPIKSVRYVGDLPDFVLDRMETAKECGLRYFTIHSAKSLPVEMVFEKVDPVMIGWYHDPDIVFMNNFWEQKRFYSMSPTAQGIVVAIWDKDKEQNII